MKNEKTSYVCPHCKKEQNTILRWQTASVCDEIDLDNGNYDDVDMVYGDFEKYSCPECGKDLPFELAEQLKHY